MSNKFQMQVRYFFIFALLVSFAIPGAAYAAPTPSAPMYVSFDGAGSVTGITSFADDDILRFDGTTWDLYFDGSDVGLASGQDITAFAFLDPDNALFVFDETVIIDTVEYTSNDIVLFHADSWMPQTLGSFSLFMDGPTVGLDTSADRIDALSILPDGSLLISTTGNPGVPGVAALEADILKFTPTTPGNYTAGTWSLYFDASDVSLGETSDEDVTALDVVNNVFHLATLGAFTVGTVSGENEDIFTCTLTQPDDPTVCGYDAALYFDGSSHVTALTGDGQIALDAFSLDRVTGLPLTVSGITAANKVYNGTTTASINVGSATLNGVQGLDDVTLVTTGATGAFADANVGTGKTVNISGLTLSGADAGKYSLTQPTTTANITKAPLTVTADNKTKTVVQPDPAFTFTYSGFVNAETGAVIDTPPTCGVSGSHNTPGTYPIVCSGGVDNNYSFTYVNGTLTVTETAPGLGPDTTGVFRPSNGALYLKHKNTSGFADVQINYGQGGDYPVVGDWDGNGTATIGIYRNGTFYLRNSNTIGFADIVIPFGQPGDQPIAGDWNNDGIDTIGVYRSSSGAFLLRNQNTTGTPDIIFHLGSPGDVGIAGDWNGDGVDTTGVFRPSNGALYLKNTNATGFADIQINYGLPGDKPVTGDWDGDGDDTIGIYRNGQFMLRNSNTIGFADIVFSLGVAGDHPIAGNWDGKP